MSVAGTTGDASRSGDPVTVGFGASLPVAAQAGPARRLGRREAAFQRDVFAYSLGHRQMRVQRRPWRLPLGPVGGRGIGTGVLGVVALYAGGWGVGLYDAIAYLGNQEAPMRESWVDAGGSIANSLFGGILLIWAALMFASSRGISAANLGLAMPRGSREWWGQTTTMSVYTLLTFGAFTIGDWLADLVGAPAISYPEVPSAPGNLDSLVSSLMAGPTEEIVLLAVTVTVLRRAGRSWGWVAVFDVVMRVSFHAYYGWGALGLVFWAAGAMVLYARTGRLLGLLVAHSLWDALQDVSSATGLYSLVPWWLVITGVLTILGLTTGAFRSLPPAATAPHAGGSTAAAR